MYHLHQKFLIHFEQVNDVLFCNFLSRFDTLLSKSVFVTKFVWANLALKITIANLLNSGVSIYLS